MTTFKNNAKYAEVLLTYLDVAFRGDTPLTVREVLDTFVWRFKGGSLSDAASRSLYPLDTSATVYPDGLSSDIAREWPEGKQARALALVLRNRLQDGRLRARGVMARIGTYKVLVSQWGGSMPRPIIYTGMRSIYHVFGVIWEWAAKPVIYRGWTTLADYTRELVAACGAVSKVHVETADGCRLAYQNMMETSRLRGLLEAIRQIKEVILRVGGAEARQMARMSGLSERDKWGHLIGLDMTNLVTIGDDQENTRCLRAEVGPLSFRLTQGVVMSGLGTVRYALGLSDLERLHQVVMSTASCLVGVCAQSVVGTEKQKLMAHRGVRVTERNVTRMVASSRKVALGDEVLVCKAYRRAYTAVLGRLAGPMCAREAEELMREARETAGPGVIDVDGFVGDAMTLDAATALNACKVFKICPAPDVSPGAAMIDRVLTIGQGNKMDAEIMSDFEAELTSQILRAYIRGAGKKLKFRDGVQRPIWGNDYVTGNPDKVPSVDIDKHLKWEGTLAMPELSAYDPTNWKDSGLGVDTIEETTMPGIPQYKKNMLTRLLYDETTPTPGVDKLSREHVIKFFVKAEGHKDPARGIFSANLTDRFAQSWMERAVDDVARMHPSYMIGQEVDDREAKVRQLTARPTDGLMMALYYSFDISGWSAKMPAEPQRISHQIWGKLYGHSIFDRAHEINEGAHIYVDIDGYKGWFRNTHSNLEGFNGKEMTMVLVTLLSLSVRRWRKAAIEGRLLTEAEANMTSALLFAYIDDGLSRIDLPRRKAMAAFDLYKKTVIETFSKCGFSVEVSKCFPSDRFSIFLNEVYLAGRHVVHGVRAAMGISAEPTERHTSLVERVTAVSAGVRGAVMAGLSPLSATLLMAYHVFMHLIEWVGERDPVVLAGWSICPRAWGGLGIPSMLQLYVAGSGSAFEESVSTMQVYSQLNESVKVAYLALSKLGLKRRDEIGVITAPLSGRVDEGYMVDSRVSVAVRKALNEQVRGAKLSRYARRLIIYADSKAFEHYAKAVVPLDTMECLQEQMLINLAEAHPHSIFSTFARRLEKSMTLRTIVGRAALTRMIRENRAETKKAVAVYKERTM